MRQIPVASLSGLPCGIWWLWVKRYHLHHLHFYLLKLSQYTGDSTIHIVLLGAPKPLERCVYCVGVDRPYEIFLHRSLVITTYNVIAL